MTPGDVARAADIRARADAATEPTGESDAWMVDGPGWCFEVFTGPLSDNSEDIASNISHKADAEFIAAARSDVPWLLDRLAAETAEVERLVAERLTFTDALGYGDGITEPAAELRDLVDPLSAALAVAREHDEACPVWCEDGDHDGQWERPRSCEHCKGTGYGGPLRQSVENVQGWTDCDWCAGDGRDHREWRSSARLAAETERADKAEAAVLRLCHEHAAQMRDARAENERLRGDLQRVASVWTGSHPDRTQCAMCFSPYIDCPTHGGA